MDPDEGLRRFRVAQRELAAEEVAVRQQAYATSSSRRVVGLIQQSNAVHRGQRPEEDNVQLVSRFYHVAPPPLIFVGEYAKPVFDANALSSMTHASAFNTDEIYRGFGNPSIEAEIALHNGIAAKYKARKIPPITPYTGSIFETKPLNDPSPEERDLLRKEEEEAKKQAAAAAPSRGAPTAPSPPFSPGGTVTRLNTVGTVAPGTPAPNRALAEARAAREQRRAVPAAGVGPLSPAGAVAGAVASPAPAAAPGPTGTPATGTQLDFTSPTGFAPGAVREGADQQGAQNQELGGATVAAALQAASPQPEAGAQVQGTGDVSSLLSSEFVSNLLATLWDTASSAMGNSERIAQAFVTFTNQLQQHAAENFPSVRPEAFIKFLAAITAALSSLVPTNDGSVVSQIRAQAAATGSASMSNNILQATLPRELAAVRSTPGLIQAVTPARLRPQAAQPQAPQSPFPRFPLIDDVDEAPAEAGPSNAAAGAAGASNAAAAAAAPVPQAEAEEGTVAARYTDPIAPGDIGEVEQPQPGSAYYRIRLGAVDGSNRPLYAYSDTNAISTSHDGKALSASEFANSDRFDLKTNEKVMGDDNKPVKVGESVIVKLYRGGKNLSKEDKKVPFFVRLVNRTGGDRKSRDKFSSPIAPTPLQKATAAATEGVRSAYKSIRERLGFSSPEAGTTGSGKPPEKRKRFEKGSAEAKAFMAELRAKRRK